MISGRSDASARYCIGSSSLQLHWPQTISLILIAFSFSLTVTLYVLRLLSDNVASDAISCIMAGMPERVQWESLKIRIIVLIFQHVICFILHEYIRYCFVATMTYWDSLSAAAICIPVMSPAKPETTILRQILHNHWEYNRVLPFRLEGRF